MAEFAKYAGKFSASLLIKALFILFKLTKRADPLVDFRGPHLHHDGATK